MIKPCDNVAQRAPDDRRRVVTALMVAARRAVSDGGAPPCYGAITGWNSVRISFLPESGCFVGDILLGDQKHEPHSPC
jgi:hypothetical protein